MADAPIAVVGATGFTGRLTVAALLRRGATVRAIGRNPDKLAALVAAHSGVETRVVQWDAAALSEALRDCTAMVSCAGPFVDAGRPVAEAAVRARVPYCDSTGEQVFVRWVFDALDGPARAAGVALVTAAGYDYVPGDLGAAVVAEDMGPLRSLDIAYGVERADSSVGTRLSGIGTMASDTMVWRDGALRRVALGSLRRSVDFGFARMTGGVIAGGEAVQVPRHVDVAAVTTYLALPGRFGPANPAAAMLSSAMKLPGAAPLLKNLARRGAEGPEDRFRGSRFACHVQAEARDGRRRAVLVEGTDIYGSTAEALASLSLRLGQGADATGACAPAEVVEARGFLAEMGATLREVTPE